jgi:drug/metabolite transporter (DMT)-like permease
VAFLRCLYALPVLVVLATREVRRRGLLPPGQVLLGVAAGIFLALDLILWFDAIKVVGAGLATVVQDTQVVFVAAGAWLIFGARPSRRLVTLVPVLLGGVWLISGAVGSTAKGTAPLRGTILGLASAVAYAGFLLLIGWRTEHRRHRNATFLTTVTLATGATALLVGAGGGGIRVVPTWPSAGWLLLLALSTQVFGWLVISVAMARVTSARASVALLLQPVAAVIFAWALLSEAPTPVQLAGVGVVVIATAAAMAGGRQIDQRPTEPADSRGAGASESEINAIVSTR